MSRLAVTGAAPAWSAPWPKWPIYGERELALLQEVLESGHWAYDGPVETRFQDAFCALHISHPHLLASREAMQAIVHGVQKLHDERAELAAWALTEQGPDPIKINTHQGARL